MRDDVSYNALWLHVSNSAVSAEELWIKMNSLRGITFVVTWNLNRIELTHAAEIWCQLWEYQLQISLMIPAAVYCYPSGYKKKWGYGLLNKLPNVSMSVQEHLLGRKLILWNMWCFASEHNRVVVSQSFISNPFSKNPHPKKNKLKIKNTHGSQEF